MEETIETATTMTQHECKDYASNCKANTALGLSIGGLALGLLNAIGGGMAMCNESDKRIHHEHEHVQEGINDAKALGVLGIMNGAMNPWYGVI